MSYAVQRTIGKDYLLRNYGLLGLGAMRGAHPHDRVLRNYPLLGFGQEDCGADSVWVQSADGGAGACRDKSVLCGPGTQWVDADNGCVPLTKYMSAAQIAAAVAAGVNLTGGAAAPQQQVITKAAPRPSPAAPAGPVKVASFFNGPAVPWVMGAVALGIVGLAYAGHKKASHRGQHASR
jgi:hypothetical protein